ncbi:MAG: hypothetical protein KAI64_00920 [Thermoplasmata archaeon]|nr:hypothetical protein [Thermoplasmata archaeon]
MVEVNGSNEIARYDSGLRAGEGLREHRLLYSSIKVLDGFLGGFESSKVALLDGSDRFMFDFVYTLCARAVIDLNANVVYVDGGYEMNPYKLSNLCKRFRADKHDVLSRINLARAFTAYQMVTIIDEGLEKTIKETSADVVVVSCLPNLFCDKDLNPPESRTMYRRCIARLRELTEKYNLITIVTDYGRTRHERRHLLKGYLHEGADRVVRFEKRRTLRIWNESESSYVEYHPVPCNQTVLDDFLEDG